MKQEFIPMFTAGVGIAGTLLGALLGQFLTRQTQRRQWIADNKREEYRELLQILTNAYGTIVRLEAPSTVRNESEERELGAAHLAALAALRDRLFIARDPCLTSTLKNWQSATQAYSRDGEFLPFRKSYNTIHDDIVTAAHKALNI